MKKKIMSLMLALCMIVSFAMFVKADEEDEAGNYGNFEYRVNDDKSSVTITGCNVSDNTKTVTIPSTIYGKTVTCIGDSAFYDKKYLTEIIMPDTITKIESSAFLWCFSLEEISIPNSVEYIGASAFQRCDSITSITIPDSVTCIENDTFSGCKLLKNIVLPNGITKIGTNAFSGTAFYNDGENWKDGVLYLGSYLITASTTTDNELQQIRGILPTEYIIKNGTTIIADRAFYRCANLKSIELPESITEIGIEAFRLCENMNSINIPVNVKTIQEGTFSSCNGFVDFIIPDNITLIEKSAFAGCSELTNISIPENVSRIENGVFTNCCGVSISVSDNNPYYCDVDGILFSKDKTEIIAHANCRINPKYIIPETVKKIASNAFDGETGLTEITIPDGVTYIGDSAFENCWNLTSIVVPDSVTHIGKNAFGICRNLKEVTLSNDITEIDYETFWSCESLKSITLPDGVKSIQRNAFAACKSLKSIVIPEKLTNIEQWAFNECNALTDVYYGGNEEEWKAVIVDNSDTSLISATIHYNWRIFYPDTEMLPAPEAVVTESSDNTWHIEVTPEKTYVQSYVYATTYDADGNFTGIVKVPLNTDGSTGIDIEKAENVLSAKIFIWTDNMLPVTAVKNIDL